MGAKKKNGGEKQNDDGEKKKEENPITVVLKIDMHCEGCASKVRKCVKGFEGVESVRAECEANKLTIVGKVDPSKLREKLAEKTKKKVDLISPQPKKENNNDNKDAAKSDKKPNDSDSSNKKSGDKKPDDKKKPKEKEAPVTTVVLKVPLHCQGCIGKIHRIISKTKGVQEKSMDKQKDLVTVKGTMDVKALTEALSERLKKPVEVVTPKKEKDEKKDGGSEKKEGGGGGKKKGGGDGAGQVEDGNNAVVAGGGKMEGNKMEYMGMAPPGFGYGYGVPVPYGHGQGLPVPYGYGYGPGPYMPGPYVADHVHVPSQMHAPQMFSDENPNACFIM